MSVGNKSKEKLKTEMVNKNSTICLVFVIFNFCCQKKYPKLRSKRKPLVSEYILDFLKQQKSPFLQGRTYLKMSSCFPSLYFYLGENFSNKKVNSCNNKKCTSLIKSMQITFPICVIYSFCVYKKIVIQSGIKLNKSIYCSVRL